MSPITDLIGETVIDKSGVSTSTATFGNAGKVLGLYFSAHWCPPCRAFTPVLAEFYTKFKATEKGKNLELVFVSSDRDEASFKEYLNDMPWHALEFADRDRKAKLSKKYKVQGIPTLVFVDGETGKLITENGRDCIAEDAEGKDFPWHPKSFSEIIKGELLKGEAKVDAEETLKGKVKGIYFSAHWCPPCRSFTPEFIQTYTKIKERGKEFEVIFVSSDRSEDSFKEYYGSMPWLSIPFQDPRSAQLARLFGVDGIPMLVIVDENDELLTNNGRASVSKDTEGKNFPWPPQPIEVLTEDNANKLNESTCLILFTHGDEALIGRAKELMYDTAKEYQAAQKASRNTDQELPELFFFYEGQESSELADSIRSFAQLDETRPLVCVLDIPEQQSYVMPEGDIGREAIKTIADDFKAGKLTFGPLRA